MRMTSGFARVLRIFCDLGVVLFLLTRSAGAAEVQERQVTFEGVVFRVVKQDPTQVRLAWKGRDGQPMRTFARVEAELSRNGMKATVLMNG